MLNQNEVTSFSSVSGIIEHARFTRRLVISLPHHKSVALQVCNLNFLYMRS